MQLAECIAKKYRQGTDLTLELITCITTYVPEETCVHTLYTNTYVYFYVHRADMT